MIGRKNEFEKLQSAMDTDRAQLIAVYGRRRVGKTFLINEFFEGKFIFKHTAVSPVYDDYDIVNFLQLRLSKSAKSLSESAIFLQILQNLYWNLQNLWFKGIGAILMWANGLSLNSFFRKKLK